MNRRQKFTKASQPKRAPRIWLPILFGLALAVGGGLLWRSGGIDASKEQPATEPPPPRQAQPPPAPPAASDAPPSGKSRQPIFDRNMTPLAVSFKQASVYIRPIELQEGEKAVDHLTGLLGLPLEQVKADLHTKRNLFWLKRNLDGETAKKIADAKYSGVYLVDELQRYYPFHDHAAHVVGFVKEEQGLAGAEFIYDTILSGERTLASQYLNLPGLTAADLPANGAAAVVSVDIDLQIILEKKIQYLQQQTGAQSASAVVMDATSGEILAMANVPAYDPNVYWKAAVAAHQNAILREPVPLAGINAFVKAAAELAAGNLPPELAMREEEAELVINPRVMKIAKNDVAVPVAQESQVWHPGIHLSPPFAWPLAFKLESDGLTAFCTQLGLNALGSGLGDTRPEGVEGPPSTGDPCHLDDDAWGTYPLHLLAAFAQLTNGGKVIQPHLLHGIWRMDDATFHPTAFPTPEGIGAQASADFVGFVEGLLPPGPGETLILESIKSKVRLAGLARAKVQPDTPAVNIEDAIRFSSLTLAAGKQGEHQLALIMMVDGAGFNLALPSPVRKVAAEIISQGDGLMAKRWGAEVKAPKMESDATLFQQWSQSQESDVPATSSNLISLEMPDLIGMSLRKAMQAIQGYNLKVSVQGTGRVLRQVPKAGVRLKDGDEAKLELGTESP